MIFQFEVYRFKRKREKPYVRSKSSTKYVEIVKIVKKDSRWKGNQQVGRHKGSWRQGLPSCHQYRLLEEREEVEGKEQSEIQLLGSRRELLHWS